MSDGPAGAVLPWPGRSVFTAARGVAIALFGVVAAGGLKQLASLVAAAEVGPSEFGLYTLAYTTALVAASLSLLALDRGLLRHLAIYHAEGRRDLERGTVLAVLGLGLGTSLVAAVALFLLSDRLAALFTAEPAPLGALLRLMALAIPLINLLQLLNATTDARLDMRYRVLTDDLVRGGTFVLLVFLGLLLLRLRAFHLATAFVVSYLAGVLLATWLALGRYVAGESIRRVHELAKVVRFSFPLVLLQVLQRTGVYLEIFLLGLVASSAAVGIFAVADSVARVIAVVMMAIIRIYSPMVADLIGRDAAPEAERLLRHLTRWTIVWSGPAVVAALLFGRDVLQLLDGDFAQGAGALAILALAQGLNAATGPIGVVLNMSGRAWLNVLNVSLTLVLRLAAGLLLIPTLGVLGAAVGRGTVLVLLNLLMLLQVRRTMGMWGYDRATLRPALASVLAGGTAWLVSFQLLHLGGLQLVAVGSAVLGVAYAACLLRFGLADPDREILRAGWRKVRYRVSSSF